MRVLLSTYGSRGDVEPMAGLGAALQALGAEAVVSAPGDQEFVELLARAGVELAPAFMPVREWIDECEAGASGHPHATRPRMIGAQYDAIGAAAAGCDAIVATGLMPSAAAAQCVAEKRGVPYEHVSFCPLFLPSHHHRPHPYPGHPLPPDVTDPRALWDLNAQTHERAVRRGGEHPARIDRPADGGQCPRPRLHRSSAGWRRTRCCGRGSRPISATPCRPARGSCRTSGRSPADLEAFLDAGAPPVYVGFGSIALQTTKDAAQAAIEAIRAQGRRVVAGPRLGRHGPDRRPGRLLPRRRGQPAGAVPPLRRCRAPWRRGHDDHGRHGGRAAGDRAADRGPALLGGAGGRARHRRGA